MSQNLTMTKEQIFATLAVCTDKRTLARIAEVLSHKDSASGRKPEAEARLVTQKEAARRLDLSTTTVWRLIREGSLAVVSVRGKQRVRLDSVLKFAGVA